MAQVEFDLAVDCCRWNFEKGATSVAIPDGLDWPEFLRLVSFHRIETLVWSALAGSDVPEEVALSLSESAKRTIAANLKQAAECAELKDAFSADGLDILFIKGLTLSALAYGDPFLKMSSDVDILVRPEDIGRSAEILREAGYTSVTPPQASSDTIRKWHRENKESAWLKQGTAIFIELHSQLADNPHLIPAVGMAAPRQEVSIGAQWTLPTLATDDLLSYLFVHGAGSSWFRLKWISDVAAVLSRMTQQEMKRIYRVAVASNAGRAPAQALLLANRLFGIPLGQSFRKELLNDPVTRFLEKVALRELRKAEEPTGRFGGTAVMHLARPLLLEGWSFAAGDLVRQIHNLVRRRVLFR